MNSEIKEVAIDKLKTENLQIRVEMLEECVEDYAEKYREDPKALPPVVVFYDFAVDEYYLADGFHRVAAVRLNGGDKIAAEVHEGTFNDALRYALQANAKNGIYRTNADKHHAIEIAWAQWDTLFKDEERTTPDGLPSARQLGRLCAVSKSFAGKFMEEKRVSTVDTPIISKVPGRELLATSKRVANMSATVGTSDHLEERNSAVRALLAEGKDRYGVTIPERIKHAFLSIEPRAFMRELGRVRNTLDERRIAEDIAFVHTIDYALRDLDATIRDLRQGMAHCVCRMCRGMGCASCSDFGFQTKLQYDMVPSEYKAEKR